MLTVQISTLVLLLAQVPDSNDGILAGGADPSIVATPDEEGNVAYYVAATGRGIRLCYSPDLKNWKTIGRAFNESVPTWAKREVPGSRGIWAPDLSFHITAPPLTPST